VIRLRSRSLLFSLCLLTTLVACRSKGPDDQAVASARQPQAAEPTPANIAARPKIVALGDSLTAGYGLNASQAYPALLQRRLDAAGRKFEVVNAGVSGDTSAGGLRRLDWALEGDVKILIVALGGNDGLRGLPVVEMKRNLSKIIETAQARGITVVLAGIEAPPNYGQEYVTAFRAAFRDLADTHHVVFIPFLLDKVAGLAHLNLGDGIHPNEQGAAIVSDTVWDALKPVLDQVSATQ
jgi:acyl-CoA thioesterase I